MLSLFHWQRSQSEKNTDKEGKDALQESSRQALQEPNTQPHALTNRNLPNQ
jgi:hypothetical protein